MFKLKCIFVLFVSLNVFAQPTSLRDFARFSQYQQLIISPSGDYLATSMQKEDGEPLVAVIDIRDLSIVFSLEFKKNEVPGDITWLNEKRIGMPLYYSKGSRDYPVSYGDYFASDIDGRHRKKIWGELNKGGIAVNPTLTSMEIVDLIPEDPNHIIVYEGASSNNKFNKAYKLNVYSGRKQTLATSPIRDGDFLSDKSQQIRFASGIEPEGDENIFKIFHRESNDNEWELLYRLTTSEGRFVPIAFQGDNKTVLALSSLDSDKTALVSFNVAEPTTLKTIYRHESVDIDLVLKDNSNEVYGVVVSPDYELIETPIDHPLATWIKRLKATFPNYDIRIASSSSDQTLQVIKISSAKNPGAYYLFDKNKNGISFITSASPWIQESNMAEMHPISFETRDGLVIHGYLSNASKDKKPKPLIVLPHGGPHGVRDFWYYDPDVQMLASLGYSVLQVNYRGSSGYGRKFSAAGYGQWGADMQNDITDATLWAIDNGVADADNICIYGSSYGAYAALMGVVLEPDLYQCAIGFVGVYDLNLMFEEGDIQDRKTGLNYLKAVLGEDKASLNRRSPVANVKNISADLLLIHGGKDERAPIEHLEALTDALDEHEKNYETLIKPNEGHGFYKLDNREEMYQQIKEFLAKHLKI